MLQEYIRSLNTGNLISFIFTVVIGLSVFVEISPIKINPWSHILKSLGDMIFKSTDEKIEKISEKVEKISEKVADIEKIVDDNEIDHIRWEILNFANTCRNGTKHTKDEFQHVIAQNTKYEMLLKKTKRENGVYEAEYEYIMEIYHQKRIQSDFL